MQKKLNNKKHLFFSHLLIMVLLSFALINPVSAAPKAKKHQKPQQKTAQKSATKNTQKQEKKKTNSTKTNAKKITAKQRIKDETKKSQQKTKKSTQNTKKSVIQSGGSLDSQKKRAQAQSSEVAQRLNVLKKEISQTTTEKNIATDKLAQSEAAISNTNRKLNELSGKQRNAEFTLKKLTDEQTALEKKTAAQKEQLSRLLRDNYMEDSENRSKLLLSGDNPNRIMRNLQYMDYVSAAQAQLITKLKGNIQTLNENKIAAQKVKNELDVISKETQNQKVLLEKEKQNRAALLAQVSEKLSSQKKEANQLEKDQQRLSALVDRLTRQIIEAQRRAAEEAERQRRLALLREQRLKKLSAKERAREKEKERTSAPVINKTTPTYTGYSGGNFATLKGKLRLPAQGAITARFGNKRDDGPSWKGVFIRAAEGSSVHAVANGKVVFADWLRGFGNIMIIDHGNQYMTIYGNNKSLYKRVGETIKTGEVIAGVGNSGGNEQSGLYFEMRHRGRAFDPMTWVSR